MIRKILIASRGEIVNRIIRSALELKITPVVLFSDADEGFDYIDSPVEKHLLKGSTLASTYLNRDQIISIAKKCKADAIHPGYGFLSENADFARQVEENNLTWIGPSPAVMLRMSGKESSRREAIAAGIPVPAAISGTPAELTGQSGTLRFPVLVKAVSGGGGRGMRIITDPSRFASQVEAASVEALQAFGDPRVFVEEFIDQAKHIEVQVIGDKYGTLVHLFERECTIQRRYQKIIEESPSPSITSVQRNHILSDAAKIARAVGYDSAGTVEFIVDNHGRHFFLEMNTRIQVEHPVTEMITGIDLVSEQIRVAGGHCLSFGQEDVSPTGHAIECRICAEDPALDFDPRPGAVSLFRMPEGSGIRVDHAVGSGFSVSHRFDSMIAKVIVHADTREKAIGKMVAALDQTRVHGVETTRDFIRETLLHPGFTDASFHTDFIREHGPAINRNLDHQKAVAPDPVFRAAFQALGPEKPGVSVPSPEPGPWSALGSWRLLRSKVLEYRGTTRRVTPVLAGEELNGAADCSIHPDGSVWVSAGGFNYRLTEPLNTRVAGNRAMDGASVRKPEDTGVFAPLPGLLSRVMVNPGDAVAEGDVLAIIESMKTENRILAASGGKIGAILASEGQQVALNQRILEIEIN